MKFVVKIVFAVVAVSLAFYAYGRVGAISDNIAIERNDNYASSTFSGTVRVATYNIAHGRGPKLGESNWSGNKEEKKSRLVEIGKYLKNENFDLVVLNEVDFSASWSGNLDQARIIAEAGEFPYFVRQINYDLFLPGFSLQFGNALLSRFPIKNAKREKLPALRPVEHWFYGNHDALRADIALGPIDISIWGLHLEVRDEQARIQAVEHILKNIKEQTILVGDLNSRPSSKNRQTAYDMLLASNRFDSFPRARSKKNTFPTERPERVLDWILFPNNWMMAKGNVWQVDYSDHLPVSAELEIR